MKLERIITAIDTHTVGEPTRIITGGVPRIPGDTMLEKKAYLEENMDWLRTALMREPRGHADMFGAIITSPVSPGADVGVIFMDTGGYATMCGHGTIGTVTTVLETGMVTPSKPLSRVTLDAPAGVVSAVAEMDDEGVKSVTIRNVPSFVYARDVGIRLPSGGRVNADIAFGGNFYAVVQAADLDVKVLPENVAALIELGMAIKDAANAQMQVIHPENPGITSVFGTIISGDPVHPEADLKNGMVFANGSIDRSPCGTGTSARMACLEAHGKLKLGEMFVHESILGTLFRGRLAEETQVGPYRAFVPEVTASAYITGFQQFVIDSRDPLRYGFLLGQKVDAR